MSLVMAAKGGGSVGFFFIDGSFHYATRWALRRAAGLLHQGWPPEWPLWGRGADSDLPGSWFAWRVSWFAARGSWFAPRGSWFAWRASWFARRASPLTRSERLIRRSMRTERILLRGIAERDRDAGLFGARGAADAVNVVLRHFRQLEIDHVRDVIDVDAAGGDVGRDKDPRTAALELLRAHGRGRSATCCRG